MKELQEPKFGVGQMVFTFAVIILGIFEIIIFWLIVSN